MRLIRRKPLPDSDNNDSLIRVVVTMRDGRVIKGKCSEKEYADACYDLRRHNPRPDSNIYILTVIAHPADFTSIERG